MKDKSRIVLHFYYKLLGSPPFILLYPFIDDPLSYYQGKHQIKASVTNSYITALRGVIISKFLLVWISLLFLGVSTGLMHATHLSRIYIKCYLVSLLVFTKSRISYRKYFRDHETLPCYLHMSNPVVLIYDKTNKYIRQTKLMVWPQQLHVSAFNKPLSVCVQI